MTDRSVPSWVTLERDERIIWRDRPSLWLIARRVVSGMVAVVLGVGGVVLLSGMWRLLPIGLALVGIIYSGLGYADYRRRLYLLTSTELYKRSGVFSQTVATVSLESVQNTSCTQSPFQRLVGCGKISIQTAGTSGTELVFESVPNPWWVSQQITEQLPVLLDHEQAA